MLYRSPEGIYIIMYNFSFKGFHHVAMATNDIDTTVRFWRDLLGMRLVLTMGEDGRRMYFLEVSGVNFLAFFEWPEVERSPYKVPGVPVKGPFMLDHLSFALNDMDELWNLAERLIAAGFFVSNVMDHGMVRAFYTFDPNGIPIEFCVESEGIDLRKEPRMLDEEPSDTAREGFEPDPHRWPTPDEGASPDERIVLPGKGRKRFDR